MINEASQAGVFTLAAIAIAVGVDVSQIPDVDGTTVAGGGVGLALMWVARGAFKRADELLDVLKSTAEALIKHTQRTSNLHALALNKPDQVVEIGADLG